MLRSSIQTSNFDRNFCLFLPSFKQVKIGSFLHFWPEILSPGRNFWQKFLRGGYTLDMSPTSHNVGSHPPPPQILWLSEVRGNFQKKWIFGQNPPQNFKNRSKGVEISTPPKISGWQKIDHKEISDSNKCCFLATFVDFEHF